MLFSQNLFFVTAGLILAWLALSSFFLWRAVSSYRRLTSGVDKKRLDEVLEKILKDFSAEKGRVDKLIGKVDDLQKDSTFHIQKVGLVRFNPFSDTGGNQSFVLALLDGQDSGLIFSTLHSREQTRVYAKPIKKGKASGFDLSKEEKEAIKNAKKTI